MLTFIKYGSGPIVWLAFHGIGQDSRCFEPFAKPLASTHTIYSVDLPFHGESRLAGWPSVITSTYWQSLLTEFMARHRIDRFSVVGFSIGGRFALITAQLFANRVGELVLLAPDGITQNPWFTLATSTKAGRALLRFFLNNTPLFTKAAHVLVKAGLLNASLLRFGEATMQTPAQRTQIYQSWTGFRLLRIDRHVFAKTMIEHGVQVRLFLGMYDVVLPQRRVQPLIDLLPNSALTLLPTGHTSLVKRVAEQL
ncbi:alpha/beta hydrolase [Fibrella arboris]|uniref:alpha/beta hydrolase n=1 Tax=Fibrella arboris TaxID=3242486 RepID=UPI0035210048